MIATRTNAVRHVAARRAMASKSQSNGDATTQTDMQAARQFDTLLVSRPHKHIAHVQLNTPKVKNAFGLTSARELTQALDWLDGVHEHGAPREVRAIVLSGNGADFTAGVDLRSFMTVYARVAEQADAARKARLLRDIIAQFQTPFRRMLDTNKPIVCALHGISYGLAMELAACSDVRVCSQDTRLAIREVLIGIAADVGSLQLLPHLINNQSRLRELIYTGRDFDAQEALQLGFVSSVHANKQAAVQEALDIAQRIAQQSPVAVQGSKHNLRFSSDKPFGVGLDYNATWNACMMQSDDLAKAIGAIMNKQQQASPVEPPQFDDF